jgi:hypothetical protein
MNVPSQIMELARVEVMSAKADLAGRMNEQVSTRWILTHLYKFSEDEAAQVMKEREVETIRRGAVDAEVQSIATRAAAATEAEVAPPEEAPSEETPAEAISRLGVRLSKLIVASRRDDWRREFEGSKQADKRVEAKLDKVLKENHDLARKLRGLDGLLGDIRTSLRGSAAMGA